MCSVRFNTASVLQLIPEDALYLCVVWPQESLITAKAEALKWRSLYEEQQLISGQHWENQHLSSEQLQQLQSQVEVQYTVIMCMIRSLNEV